MKRLSVKKTAECMACLECVRACSTAFYKEFNEDLSCIRIVAKGSGAKPMTCIQCGKCMKSCEFGAITQNPKTRSNAQSDHRSLREPPYREWSREWSRCIPSQFLQRERDSVRL